jgi:tripartite tricarboxylate transporter family receptor
MIDRRRLLGAAAALPALAATARAQDRYPSRNITMIVPYPPGGQADFAARPIAKALEKILGRAVIVDNRGGAGGAIGNAAGARATPDGYTLLMGLPVIAVLPEADRLFGRTPAYEMSQLQPVARILADPALLAVPGSAPWKTAQEFIDDAKNRPGQITYGSSGIYGTTHVAMEVLAQGAGIKLVHGPLPGRGSGRHRAALWPDSGHGLGAGLCEGARGCRRHAHPRQLGRGADRELPRHANLQGTRAAGCGLLQLGRALRPEGRVGACADAAARDHAASDAGSGGGQRLRQRRQRAGLPGRARVRALRREGLSPPDSCRPSDR